MSNDENPKENLFQLVKSKKSKRKSFNFQKRVENSLINKEYNEINIEDIIRKIHSIKNDLIISEYLSQSLELIKESLQLLDTKNIDVLICFGLGRFSDCITSRYQLAYCLCILEHFKVEKTFLYDPIFSAEEVKILEKLGCCLLTENLEGKYKVNSNEITLFYLPHCPKQLTNNILWKNWSVKDLNNTIIIGNSFTNLNNLHPERLLYVNAEYIIRILPYIREIVIRNSYKFSDIFNDTSIHIFPLNNLNKIESEFWLNNKEPIYKEDDIELITKEIFNKLNIT